MTARPMATSTGSGREPGLVAVGHDSSPSGTIDFSENMLIVEGMVFVPDNRRYLTQAAGWWRQTLAACRRAVKSRAINSNVTPIREDAGAA
jgi:hypothetical protein